MKPDFKELHASWQAAEDTLRAKCVECGDERTDEQSDAIETLADDVRAKRETFVTAQKKYVEDEAREQSDLELATAKKWIDTPAVPGDLQGMVAPEASVREYAKPKAWGPIKHYRSEEECLRAGMSLRVALGMSIPKFAAYPVIRQAQRWCADNGVMAVHQEKDNLTGGVFVAEEFDTTVIRLIEERGVARQLCRNVPMGTDSKWIPRRTGGLTAYAVGEGSSITESTAATDRVQLVAKDWGVLTRASNDLLEDAFLNATDFITAEIAYAFADKEDQSFINGDGTSTYGGIVGLRTKLLDFDGGGTDSTGIVNGEGSDRAALLIANFNSMVGLLPQYADNPNTVWVCHKTFWANVMQRLTLAAGGATTESFEGGTRKMFLGYPVVLSQVMPSADVADLIDCMLGDFSQACAFGDRRQISIAFSEHATINSVNVFEVNELGIRGMERFDIAVHDVGDASDAGPVIGLTS